jgi:hypothetical protein
MSIYKYVVVCFQGHITTYPIASWIYKVEDHVMNQDMVNEHLFIMAIERKIVDIEWPWCIALPPPSFTEFPSAKSKCHQWPLEDMTIQSFMRYYRINANNACKYCIITLSQCKSIGRNKCQDQVLKGCRIFRVLVINYKFLIATSTLSKNFGNP